MVLGTDKIKIEVHKLILDAFQLISILISVNGHVSKPRSNCMICAYIQQMSKLTA
jgi:hypothetical protein